METIKLTKQEAFNRMVRGLAAQGWQQARVPEGSCRYRTGNGLKCAVGQLIPDDRYHLVREGSTSSSALKSAGIEIEGADAVRFAGKCQLSHDGAFGRLDMHRKFQQVAEIYGLDFPADCIAEGTELL